MSFSHPSYPEEKEARYQMLLSQSAALLDETLNPIANLANIAALLADALPQINWCGFYLMDHGALTLGPFCGLPACTRIQPGRGVCGTAVQKDRVLRIANVHEIVLPIRHQGRVIGVLDIDSPTLARFDETDEQYLSELVIQIQKACSFDRASYTL